MKFAIIVGFAIVTCFSIGCAEDDAVKNLKVTHKVWFDMKIGNVSVGRIEIGLFGEVVPRTVKNFFELSKSSRRAGYKGSTFYMVFKDFAIGGGDYTKDNGTGGYSIYGYPFADENFKLQHYGAGWISMANAGEPHTNGSMFLITLKKLDVLNGRFVVFAKVIKGMSVIRKIENLKIGMSYKPLERVVIADCGAEIVDKPFVVSKTDATE